MKMQIYQEVLSAVVEETEINPERILSGCKEEEVVDARYILVKTMNERGLYPTQISQLTSLCHRSINKFLIGFWDRCNSRNMMRINYYNVRNHLGMSKD